MRQAKIVGAKQYKEIRMIADVIAGPERAALLGVPVGTRIGSQQVYWHRNPVRRMWWKVRHPNNSTKTYI